MIPDQQSLVKLLIIDLWGGRCNGWLKERRARGRLKGFYRSGALNGVVNGCNGLLRRFSVITPSFPPISDARRRHRAKSFYRVLMTHLQFNMEDI